MLIIRGQFDLDTGLGNLGALLARQLAQDHIDFQVVLSPGCAGAPRLAPEIHGRAVIAPAPGATVLHIGGALDSFAPAKNIAWWCFWETTKLPAGAVDLMNACGLVIVSCHWSEFHFRRQGVHVPIHVLPCIVAPEFRPIATWPPPAPFTLLAGGEPRNGPGRKGMDLIVETFQEAFPPGEHVRLCLKLGPGAPMPQPADQRVSCRNDWITGETLACWYRSGHVFVSASSAEGFGLWPAQALACGIPVIGASYAGQAEYLSAKVGFPLVFREGPPSGPIYAGRGKWAVIDRSSLVRQMRAARQEFLDGRLAHRAAAAPAAVATSTGARVTQALLAILPQSAPARSTMFYPHYASPDRPQAQTASIRNGSLSKLRLLRRRCLCLLRRLFHRPIPVICIPVLNRGDLLTACLAAFDRRVRHLVIINNGQDADVALACAQAARHGAHVIAPRGNLGVAGSWNYCLDISAPYYLLINNDIALAPGALARLARATAAQPASAGAYVLPGDQQFSCFTLTAAARFGVGRFDENFWPAYYEDRDYLYRCRLAGLHFYAVQSAQATHGDGLHPGSMTIASDAKVRAANDITLALNRDYYRRKWGGDPGHETFWRPFNNPNLPLSHWVLDPSLRAQQQAAWSQVCPPC
jgi:glycosyltransferase involved in cell wall biosynthesis